MADLCVNEGRPVDDILRFRGRGETDGEMLAGAKAIFGGFSSGAIRCGLQASLGE